MTANQLIAELQKLSAVDLEKPVYFAHIIEWDECFEEVKDIDVTLEFIEVCGE